MENPATWGPAERVVREVLDEDHKIRLSPEPLCGLSLERRITDALRKEGLLSRAAYSPGQVMAVLSHPVDHDQKPEHQDPNGYPAS